ncbi:MAG: cytoplasmic protein [Myxococcota bacterium]
MSEADQGPASEIEVDPENLYREEIFTDLKVATIRRLTPIQADGSDDVSRPVMFVGQTTLLSQAGPVPVQCQIEATSLEGALAQFPNAINEAIERMIDEARELQRQEASRIVVPGREPAGKPSLR